MPLPKFNPDNDEGYTKEVMFENGLIAWEIKYGDMYTFHVEDVRAILQNSCFIPNGNKMIYRNPFNDSIIAHFSADNFHAYICGYAAKELFGKIVLDN